VRRLWAAALGVALLACGCRYGEMYDQPKYRPYDSSTFFADGNSARPLVDGTVARVEAITGSFDAMYLTGRDAAGKFVREVPSTFDRATLERGQGRYRIFCAPCHGVDGGGRGPIVLRGFSPPPKLYEPKVVNQPIGYYFDVISNGHGAMYGYAARIPVSDRWAIAGYLRALQLSQDARPEELPETDRKALDEAAKASPVAAASTTHGSEEGAR
jgi:mono/diheme cytochrome c family protein